MANLFISNPMILDTVIATSIKAQLQVATAGFPGLNTQFTFKISGILWESPATIGDTFVIKDPAGGNVLWLGTCEVALQSQYFNWSSKPRLWRDFALPTLASGKLYIDWTM